MATNREIVVQCRAPVNMAVLKYWGKRDEQRILPLHDSLSATLHVDCMASSITITASDRFDRDQMLLNGKEVEIGSNVRLTTVIEQCRAIAGKAPVALGGDWAEIRLHLDCHNDFPTAAGLASSASGYACLTAALCELYQCKERFPGQISSIARQGSGSACRSMHGGFVQWASGNDSQESIAIPVAPESHWPELRVLILVANDAAKTIGSTVGMRRSTETSTLLEHRAKVVVPARLESFRRAIALRDFTGFGELTMRDSNQFHAVCADTYPPIFYLNSTSHAIIDAVHTFNESRGAIVAAYTFDAGPNACIFTLDETLSSLAAYLLERFCPANQDAKKFVRDPLKLLSVKTDHDGATFVDGSHVKQMIVTKVGPGPIATTRS